jgi:hypothetical protein
MLFAHQMPAQLQAKPATNPHQDAVQHVILQQQQQQLQVGNASTITPSGESGPSNTCITNNHDDICNSASSALLGKMPPLASTAVAPDSEQPADPAPKKARVSHFVR